MKRKIILVAIAFVLVMVSLVGVVGVINYRLAQDIQTNLSEYPSISQARMALKKDPNDFVAHRTLAQYYFHKHDSAAAVTEWETVVQEQPQNRAAKSMLVSALIQAGQKQKAISTLTELSQQDDVYGRIATDTLHRLQKQ